MANIEEHAIQRDKRFLVRLVLVMLVAIFAGLFIWGQLTGDEVSGCAATSFGGVTEAPAEAPAQ